MRRKAQNCSNWRKAVKKIRAAAELKWNGKERERLSKKVETEAAAVTAITRSRAQAEQSGTATDLLQEF